MTSDPTPDIATPNAQRTLFEKLWDAHVVVPETDDAQGQASLTTRVHGADGSHDEVTGSGTSTDILEASALAWLDVANRLHRRQGAPANAAASRATGAMPRGIAVGV